MTVSGAIIQWLKRFNPTELWKMGKIDTDLMHGDVDYSLVKEPVANVKKYINGSEVHTEHYQIRARLDCQTNNDCVDNEEWLEALTLWIDRCNKAGDFPSLADVKVQQIGIATPFYMGKNEENKAIYQMTIFIRYRKEGEELL